MLLRECILYLSLTYYSETSALEMFFAYAGFLADIERAPLALHGLILENPYLSTYDLATSIVKHYATSVLSQIYLVCKYIHLIIAFG